MRELELEEQFRLLKEQVASLQKSNEEVQPPIPQDDPLGSQFMELNTQDEDPLEEERPLSQPITPSTDREEYFAQELELMAWIQSEYDEITKQSMEWEQRILHLANLTYLKYGEASKD